MMIFAFYLSSFWCSGIVFAWMDFRMLHSFTSYFTYHRIQPLKHPFSVYRKCAIVVLRNQFCIQLPLQLLLEDYYDLYLLPKIVDIESYTIVKRILQIFVFISVVFTITHLVYHFVPIFYQNIHKTHHEFTNPIAISTEYNSVLEEFINWSYTLFAFILFPIPKPWIVFVLIVVNVTDQVGHSGYEFDLVFYCRFLSRLFQKALHFIRLHFLHHSMVRVNYSPFPIVDRIMGSFRE